MGLLETLTSITRVDDMKYPNRSIKLCISGAISVFVLFSMGDALADEAKRSSRNHKPILQTGADLNSLDNTFVQPQDSALSGGGRDQTLQFGDVLRGSRRDDLLNGRLGTDLFFAGRGDDIMIGGLEHFNPANRDRAFGGRGNDIFIWKPGDGSDFFEGSFGVDVLVFGITGEVVNGVTEFSVINDQQAGELAIDAETGLPSVDVSGSPGFCDIIDSQTSVEAYDALQQLKLDHLVRFSIRAVADSFESGVQTDDNGLRVTLHLKNVEILVCTNRSGGEVEVFDLTTSPATRITLDHIRLRSLRNRLKRIVF